MQSFNVDFIRNPGITEVFPKYQSFNQVENLLCYPDVYVLNRRTAQGIVEERILTSWYTLAIVSAL